MTYKSQKLTILGLIFVLSTFFFWAALNRMLIPSTATANQIKVFLLEDSIKCNPDPTGVCRLHLFIDNTTVAKIIGLSGKINYSEGLFFNKFTVDTICSAKDVGLDMELKVKPDEEKKLVNFSFGSLRKDDQLQTTGCVKTIFFKPDAGDKLPQETTVSLSSMLSDWQAVGTTDLTVNIDPKIVKIILTDEAPIDIPTETPLPTKPPSVSPVISPGGTCPLKSKGDCNCDNSVDVIDHEIFRQEISSELTSKTCDFNNNGNIDNNDYQIWKSNLNN